ncbi:MAG: hypothetical protein AVDCRST_MAG68-2088 [uncultured Gemmatimonadetes bacterium]|uniref:Holliday junction resolvase RuvC n=1 Tax=uncultured Gemmatimonadota bacterium TaxID=203437 RepID=A0A6J4L624_9BACT|nr:MAG: hypothetical protein AVDCRST_MAG68-2088 [uncultured Gemmatimonadota bacterium]
MTFVVGIDPASYDTGLAAIRHDGSIRTTTLTVTGDLPDRLTALRVGARAWLAPISDEGTWACVVERPSTRHTNASLMASYGVLLEAARSTLKCPVIVLGPAELDRLIKAPPAPSRKERLVLHARLLGWTGTSQDEADALAAADAALVLSGAARREAA